MNNSKKLKEVYRGQVYRAKLPEQKGCVLGGTHPVVIISNNTSNHFSPNVTVVPITTMVNKTRPLPTHVILENLEKPSIAMAEQLTTIDKDLLLGQMGTLTKTEMKRVEISMLVQLGMANSHVWTYEKINTHTIEW